MTDRITKIIVLGSILFILLLAVGLVVLVLGNRQTIDPDDVLGVNAKEISIESVEKNSSKESCWTILGGTVYDATSVIADNPEHTDYLIQACGNDGTDVYTVKKFSKQELDDQIIIQLSSELKNYRIGVLAP